MGDKEKILGWTFGTILVGFLALMIAFSYANVGREIRDSAKQRCQAELPKGDLYGEEKDCEDWYINNQYSKVEYTPKYK